MTKTDLQKELLEKIKLGTKPSDLKKQKQQGNINSQIPTPPDSPIITPIDKKVSKNQEKSDDLPPSIVVNKKIQQLEKDLNFWEKTASNYLSSLQKATAENDNLKEQVKELQQKPAQLNKEVATALKEANQKIRDQEKTISDLGKNNEIIKQLQIKIQEQDKTIEELKNQVNNKQSFKEASQKNNQKPKETKSFFCDSCQLTKIDILTKRKADAPFEPRLHNRLVYLCSSCSPYVKELSELNFDRDNNPYRLN